MVKLGKTFDIWGKWEKRLTYGEKSKKSHKRIGTVTVDNSHCGMDE